jgi:hypothetical protein
VTPEEWYASGDTGTSSETIWHVMTGFPVQRHGYPLDPSDFGRCYRLLERFPEWRARMPEVAARFPKMWSLLVINWDRLTALYEEEIKRPDGSAPRLYRLLRDLECDAKLVGDCAGGGHRFCGRNEAAPRAGERSPGDA